MTFKIAIEIAKMLLLRQEGFLQPSADDFISGLVKAYAIITDEHDVKVAFAAAKREADPHATLVRLEANMFLESQS